MDPNAVGIPESRRRLGLIEDEALDAWPIGFTEFEVRIVIDVAFGAPIGRSVPEKAIVAPIEPVSPLGMEDVKIDVSPLEIRWIGA